MDMREEYEAALDAWGAYALHPTDPGKMEAAREAFAALGLNLSPASRNKVYAELIAMGVQL